MDRRLLIRAAVALLGLAALVALLLPPLRVPRPLVVDAGGPGDAYFFRNMYPPERGAVSLRWTRAESDLLLPGAPAGPRAIELRLYREGDGAGGAYTQRLSAGRVELAAFDAAPGWRRYQVLLPAGAPAALRLSGPTFTPAAGDPRQLGVAIDELRVVALVGLPTPWLAPLARALWLAWLLALIVAGVWLLDSWMLGRSGAPGRPRRSAALACGLGAALLAWAWLDPPTLAWMLPTRLAATLWATLTLGGLGLISWRGGEQGNRGTGEQRNRGTGEQRNRAGQSDSRNRGTEEQRNRGTGEQRNRAGQSDSRNRGTEEQRNRGTGEQRNRAGQSDSRNRGTGPDSWNKGIEEQRNRGTKEQRNRGTGLDSRNRAGQLESRTENRGTGLESQKRAGQLESQKRAEQPQRAAPPEGGARRARGAALVAYGWVGGVGGLALAHLIALAPLDRDLRGLAALVIMAAPGALAALAIYRAERAPLERALLAAAGAFVVAPLLVMALHALPGPLPAWLLLLAADALSLLGLWALARPGAIGRPPPAPPLPRHTRWLLPGLLLAAALRLPLLGAADFQGDEAYALLLARGLLHGQDDILLVHMKGPVEALLPAGPLVITGGVSEWVARLPFALASLAIIGGVWALAGRLIGGRAGDRAGLVASLALACDGILLAFGRIVQYQSVVLLLSLGALWLCWRFYEGAAARPYLFGAAACAAVAVLAHYDGVFVAPAMAWLVIAGGRRRGWTARAWLAQLAGPALLGLALTLSFYLPFVAHEHFARTAAHLETRSGQGAAGLALFNNLPGYAQLAGFYTTRFQLVATAMALLCGLVYLLARYGRPRPVGVALALLLALAAPGALLWPAMFAQGADRSLVGLALAPPLLALALAPGLPAGLRTLVIWLGVPLLANGFLLADPRTHFYTLHLPATLLAALAATRLDVWLRLRRVAWLRAPLAGGAVALLALALPYAHLLFLRQEPEYERAFPATLVPLYRPLAGENLPDDGYFGFPRRDGWKAAGELLRRGELGGVIDSNQEIFITGWYLRGQLKCARAPDYFFTALAARPLYIPPGYQLYGAVEVDGVRRLEIYSRAPVAGPPRSFDAADFVTPFDAAPVPDFPLRRLLSGVVPQQRVEVAWAAGFGLRGFDLDRSTLGPGQSALLTLYWRATADLPATYQPELLLRDATGATVATARPVCGGMPADSWRRTYVNDTPFALDAADLPPGRYSLHLGVRDLLSGAWQPLADGAELLPLATLSVTD